MRYIYLVVIALFLAVADANAESIQSQCLSAASTRSPIKLDNIYLDGSRRYHEYSGVIFGFDEKTDLDYISINETEKIIQDIAFKKNNAEYKISPGDIDIIQADIYLLKIKSKRYFCINAPFSGLGKSGSWQKFRAAIIFPVNLKSDVDFIGIVGRIK